MPETVRQPCHREGQISAKAGRVGSRRGGAAGSASEPARFRPNQRRGINHREGSILNCIAANLGYAVDLHAQPEGLIEPMMSTHTRQAVLYSVLLITSLIFSDPASAGKAKGSTELDRVVNAVEGAESSHGTNPGMWRAEPAGPQGPMQVSEKAAIDVGGGNRFDFEQNRMLGRAYIALLHKRYGNWVDAISAYNWGPGRVDGWIKEGRPAVRVVPVVAGYVWRVLRESGLAPLSIAVQNGTSLMRIRPHIDDVFLPGLEQSGQPLPMLAGSGRPLSSLAQSGRPLSVGMQPGASYRPASMHRVLARAERLAISSSR